MVETGGWGGIAHYTWNLCQTLAHEGAEIVLLTNNEYELAALPRAFQVEPCFDGTVGYGRTVGTFLHRLSALAPDIVHVQSLISTRFDGLLWPLLHRWRPLVFTAHNVRTHEEAHWESWTLWRCLHRADAVIVHTEESARVVTQRLRSGACVRVIRHGDYAFFAGETVLQREEARRLLNLPIDAKILLAFGAIRPYKGIRELIVAFARIRDRHPDAYLVIAGPLLVGTEGEYREEICKAGVEAAVAFRPQYVPHKSVAAYFAAADVAVYNYHEVTDSGSLRLACSLDVPVVATAVGAFREFLCDGVTARLVPPHDPDALAATLSDVLADPSLAARLAGAARLLSAEKWSWAASARETLALYGSLAGTTGVEALHLATGQGTSHLPADPLAPAVQSPDPTPPNRADAPGQAAASIYSEETLDGTAEGRTVSVVLITHDEARRIHRCLESVRWAQQLVVVDQHSTDGTAEICRTYGATVFLREMRAGFGEQKAFAIAQATCPWILSLDADEEVTPALQAAIQRAVADPGPFVGFRLPRRTIYLGRFISRCGWYPSPVLRLFRRGRGRFTDALVHEELRVDGPVGDLDADLLHYSYETLSDHLRKLDLYTTYDSQMLTHRGIRITALNAPWYLCGKPLLVFLRKYLCQAGFREGRHGLILSVMAALVSFVNYAKVWEGTLHAHPRGKDD